MLTGCLVSFVFGAGMRVLDISRDAKQCEIEVARVAVHTQHVLATLEKAQCHFGEEAGLDESLLELKNVFENLKALVGRCRVGLSKAARARMIATGRPNPNKEALQIAERKLGENTQVRETSGRADGHTHIYIAVHHLVDLLPVFL